MSLRIVDVRHTGVVVTFEMSLDTMKMVVEALDGASFEYHGEGRKKECVTYLTDVFYMQLKQLIEKIERNS